MVSKDTPRPILAVTLAALGLLAGCTADPLPMPTPQPTTQPSPSCEVTSIALGQAGATTVRLTGASVYKTTKSDEQQIVAADEPYISKIVWKVPGKIHSDSATLGLIETTTDLKLTQEEAGGFGSVEEVIKDSRRAGTTIVGYETIRQVDHPFTAHCSSGSTELGTVPTFSDSALTIFECDDIADLDKIGQALAAEHCDAR